ncbi:MAG: hypothetical protein DDT29_01194 [Dehalococcoidia bacterium]|nr:hypothetical protein [Bacillota bacterium]
MLTFMSVESPGLPTAVMESLATVTSAPIRAVGLMKPAMVTVPLVLSGMPAVMKNLAIASPSTLSMRITPGSQLRAKVKAPTPAPAGIRLMANGILTTVAPGSIVIVFPALTSTVVC